MTRTAHEPDRASAGRRTAGHWWLVVLSSLVWLVLSAIIRRFAGQPAATAAVLLGAVVLLLTADELLALGARGLPPRRKVAGHAVAATAALAFALAVVTLRGRLNPAVELLAVLAAVIAAALVGGLVPALLEAVAGALLLRSFGAPHPGPAAGALQSSAVVLGLFVAVALVVGLLAEDAAWLARQAARAAEAAGPIAEADRMRSALLSAVSHDLRSPLAAAQAALSCLRAPDVQLTEDDRDELLAAVDESLGTLAHLAASLLDASRPQAGSPPAFPRPADLGRIIEGSLAHLGPLPRAVTADIPRDLPDVMADPVLTERILVPGLALSCRGGSGKGGPTGPRSRR